MTRQVEVCEECTHGYVFHGNGCSGGTACQCEVYAPPNPAPNPAADTLTPTEMLKELADSLPGLTGPCGCDCHTRRDLPRGRGYGHGNTCLGAGCSGISPLPPRDAGWVLIKNEWFTELYQDREKGSVDEWVKGYRSEWSHPDDTPQVTKNIHAFEVEPWDAVIHAAWNWYRALVAKGVVK